MSAPETPEEFKIAAWLEGFGLGQYAAAFQEHEITREVLPELSDSDLKDCGVSAIGHRKILLREIRKLTGDAPAAAVAPPAESAPDASAEPVAQTQPEPANEPAQPPPPKSPGPFNIPLPDAVRRESATPAPGRPQPPRSPGPFTIPLPDAVRREAEMAPKPVSTSPVTAKAPSRPRLGFWAKLLASKFLFVSILVHLLFGAGATYFIVQRIQAKRKVTFQECFLFH